jgi:predicted nucleic acid-binding protein
VTETPGVTLDAGALIAIERSDTRMASMLRHVIANGSRVYVPAGVVGQVWRIGSRQVRLAKTLADKAVVVVPLDGDTARAAGALCGKAQTSDVIDASVVICARSHGRTAIITSDADDLRRLDPTATLLSV